MGTQVCISIKLPMCSMELVLTWLFFSFCRYIFIILIDHYSDDLYSCTTKQISVIWNFIAVNMFIVETSLEIRMANLFAFHCHWMNQFCATFAILVWSRCFLWISWLIMFLWFVNSFYWDFFSASGVKILCGTFFRFTKSEAKDIQINAAISAVFVSRKLFQFSIHLSP